MAEQSHPGAFVALVARLRAAQKRYFKVRTREAMEEAIKLEREVDRELEARSSLF